MKHIKYIILALMLLNVAMFGYIKKANDIKEEKEITIEQNFYLNKNLLTRNKINDIILQEDSFIDFIYLYKKEVQNHNITEMILQEALDNKIPVNIFFSICYVESTFNPKAFNKNDNGSADRGLFQLNSYPRQDWEIKDFYNIEKNIKEAANVLVKNHKRYGTWESAIVFYNCGSEKNLGNYTIKYLSKILEYERKLDVLVNESYRDNIIRKSRKIRE
jgi:hypothetical protein